MWEGRDAYRFVWKGEGKQPPGRSKCRCEDDIKVDLK
jgi:hypothetical protein